MLETLKKYSTYTKELVYLSLSMIMGNIGIILIGAGDVYVAGRYSTDTLAAISIANSIVSVIFIFGVGLLLGVSPLLSNVRGARKPVKHYFYPTVKFSLLAAFLITIITLAVVPLFGYMGFEERLIPMIKSYTIILAFSTFGGYLHVGLKEFLQSYEIVFFPNFISIISIFLNIFFSFLFVFGWRFVPAMGANGIALASILVRTFMGLSVLFYCFWFFSFKNKSTPKYYKNIIKIGLPISFAAAIEFFAFNAMTILAGRVNGLYAAAQNIIIVLTSISFMIPMSISNSMAIKVGFANGAKNLADLRRYALSGVFVSTVFMSFCCILFWSFPSFIAKLFTNDLQLIEIIIPVLFTMGCFQIFDGLQVSLGGIAKGIKKTKLIFLANTIGYWFIGVPLGLYLANKTSSYLGGFWVGFLCAPIGISVVLTFVLLRYYKKMKKDQTIIAENTL